MKIKENTADTTADSRQDKLREYYKMALTDNLISPLEEAGIEVTTNILEIWEIKSKPIRNLLYLVYYCKSKRLLRESGKEDFEDIAAKVLHCTKEEAEDYAEFLISLATWVL